MRLRLNLSDVDVQIKINGWISENDTEDLDDAWCEVELSVNGHFINYVQNGELLRSCEVSWIRDTLADVFGGKQTDDQYLRFAEPDVELAIRPAKRLYSIPGKVVYRNGYMDVEASGELIINFWCSGGLGANSLKMGLGREDLFALYTYLGIVTKIDSKESGLVTSFIEAGIFLPE